MTLSVRLRHRLATVALDVSFEAPPGITVLFGRSGAGKTTIVNAVAGLFTPESGQISVNDTPLLDTARGINVAPHLRGMGYVFQEGRLFPHLSVRQNLRYGQVFGRQRATQSTLQDVTELLGLGPLLARRPHALSGGEKQRVALGRALLAQPRMILADEPLSALDEARKAEVLPYFERLRDEVGIPILYVSHAAAEVARLATTVVALKHGKVEKQGPALEVLGDPMVTPAGARAAGAVLEARAVCHHPDGLTELDAAGVKLFLPRIDRAPGAQLRVRIAASDVILSRARPAGLSALNILEGEIEQIRAGDGPGALVSLSTAAGPVLARVTMRSAQALELHEGARCYAIVKSVSVSPFSVG